MKSLKTKIAKVGAKIVRKSAIKACGAASAWGCCQPKEPKALKNLKK